MKTTEVHGFPILAHISLPYEPDCAIIVVRRGSADYVTALYKDGSSEWKHGDYIGNRATGLPAEANDRVTYAAALNSMWLRATRRL